jgi:hypothetical protein
VRDLASAGPYWDSWAELYPNHPGRR